LSEGDRPRDDDDERTLSPDEETLPGPIPGASVPQPGPAEREDQTVHAEFAGGGDDPAGPIDDEADPEDEMTLA